MIDYLAYCENDHLFKKFQSKLLNPLRHMQLTMASHFYSTDTSMITITAYLLSLLLLISLPPLLALTPIVAAPCRVQNVMVQPHFGLSSKTKQLVDILQAPPFFTQTIHAGICAVNENAFSQTRPLSSLPHYMCRQRYVAVEVYTKSQQDFHAVKSLQTILKLPEQQMDFTKDFILIEAGCDFLINFLPWSTYAVNNAQESNLIKTALAQLSTVSSSKDRQSNQLSSYAENTLSNVKPRMVQLNDFFRQGLHLKSDTATTTETTTSTPAPTTTVYESTETTPQDIEIDIQDQDTVILSENHPVENFPHEKENDSMLGSVTSDSDKDADISSLPVLILESSLDPVLKLISKYSTLVQEG